MERLTEQTQDLVVIGGGVTGAAIALLAQRNGLQTAILERGDFASATSSASSKLIHGGLRYLRMGDLGLVREALDERNALRRSIAPHLVRGLPFLFPVYRGGPYRPAAVRLAMRTYGVLGKARRDSRYVSAAWASQAVPSLLTADLRGAGWYFDAQTDDARLSLENVVAAVEEGALALNYAEVCGIATTAGRATGVDVVDTVTQRSFHVRARALINASGASVDVVRRLETPSAGTSVRLSKGTHITVDPLDHWSAALIVPVDSSRVTFAIPWRDVLLLGTTDEPFEGDATSVAPTQGEVEQILAEAGLALPAGCLRVRSAFAGLRVLPLGRRGTERSRREVELSVGPAGMISVAGGKLTTYRRTAELAVRAAVRDMGRSRLARVEEPLPCAVDPLVALESLVRANPDVDLALIRHLVALYGRRAGSVLSVARQHPDGFEPIAGGSDVVAQVIWARENEFSVTVDDVLRRRTSVVLAGRDSAATRFHVQGILGQT